MNPFSASADDPAARRAFLGLAAGAAGLAGVSAFGAEAPPAAAPVFSVRDFGARGDGVSDDTDAAQAAVDAAVKARGGRVHFPSGSYRLTRTVTVASSDRLDLTGDGFSSVLLHAGPEHCLAWAEGSSCRESSVRDLCIVAAGQSKAPGTAAIACLGGAERSLFSHLLLTGGDIRMGSGILTR
ncbi:MAG TPA: glycosyl hydrolase family 28-related protein, partial [Candidatus Hydrogenedentes bacterium]|nr:glycosyl hydrolase family 28-related protein [Candidatus Hydrogenedentota bacterium]